LKEIEKRLAQEALRRKRWAPAILRVLVDGIEQGLLDPSVESKCSCLIRRDAELIEVKSAYQAGDLTLATYLLDQSVAGRSLPRRLQIRLEGNQEISFEVSLSRSDPQELTLTVGYRDRSLHLYDWFGAFFVSAFAHDGHRRAVLAGLLLLAIVVLVFVAIRLRQMQSPAPARIAVTATPAPVAPTVPVIQPEISPAPQVVNPPPPGSTPPANRHPKHTPASHSEVAVAPSPTPLNEIANVDVTRDRRAQPQGASLPEVKRVFVEAQDDADSTRRIVDSLNQQLSEGKSLTLVKGREQADALLKVHSSMRSHREEISTELVNVDGRILWSFRRALGSQTPAQFSTTLINQIRFAQGANAKPNQ
jgi:hypothetical protein